MNNLGAPLALRFRLFRHCPLHFLRQVDVLQFDQNDFDPPRIGLLIEDLLNPAVDPVAFGQQFIELRLAAYAAQRHLSKLRGGE